MEQDNKTSLWQYNLLQQTAARSNTMITIEAVEQLVGLMEHELLIDGCSPLFNVAAEMCLSHSKFKRLFKKYVPKSYTLDSIHNRTSVYDAYILISCLVEHMSGRDIAHLLDEALPHFCSSSPVKLPDKPTEDLNEMFRTIDRLVPQRRTKLFLQIKKATIENGTSLPSYVQTETSDCNEKIYTESDSCNSCSTMAPTVAAILGAQEPAVREAQVLAEQIIAGADALASRRIAAANQRIIELTHPQRLQHFQEAQRMYSEGIYALQKSLQDINGQMNQICEQTCKLNVIITKESIQKAHTNLIELYNLIADARDSQMKRVNATQNEDLKNSVFNLDIFMDMISEYLADYGIITISTEPCTPFNATYHMILQVTKENITKPLVVCKSVRKGFAWGNRVLQKERVEVQ